MTTPTSHEIVSRFHTSDDKFREYAQSAMKKALESGKIGEDDGELILKFSQFVKGKGKTKSDSRYFKIISVMIRMREFFPMPFRECTIEDIYCAKDLIDHAKTAGRTTKGGKVTPGTPFKENTKADFVRFMKRFFKWMVKKGHSSIDIAELDEIEAPAYQYDTKKAEDLLSKEEIFAMLKKCQNSRDRAIIGVLYDGALRIGELGTLRWNKVRFTDYNAVLTVKFKTDKERTIPLFMAKEYLAAWKNDYPGEPSGENFVFLTNGGGRNRTGRNQLQYAGLSKQIRKIAERAGIKKKIVPHIFRHSKITHLIRDRGQESMIKMLGWGNTKTDMLDKCYLHLTDDDVAREMARLNNVEIEEKPRSKILEPRQCPHCGEINGPHRRWCVKCETALTEDAREQVKTATEQAEALPFYKEMEQRWQQKFEEMQKDFEAKLAARAVKGSA